MGLNLAAVESASTTRLGGQGSRKRDLPSLDGLRAVSIVLVLVGHAVTDGHRSLAFRALTEHADLGVRVFFVISGFLITSLLLEEKTQFGSISLRLFYIRRALRILPAFFLFVGCVALLSVFRVTPVPVWSWLYVLTYTVNFAPFPPFPWVFIHLWSLSVEEQFYLLWPLALRGVRSKTCIAVAILAILARPATHELQVLCKFTLPGYGPFPLVCCPIAMGSLLAMGSSQVRSLILRSKFLSGGRALLCALILIFLLDCIHTPDDALGDFLTVVQNSMLTLCVARLVFIPTDMAGRLLNSTPFVIIGKLSYSLYLWQELFLYKLAGKGPLKLALAIVLIFLAASISYWGLEVRFLGLRKKFRQRSIVLRDSPNVQPGD